MVTTLEEFLLERQKFNATRFGNLAAKHDTSLPASTTSDYLRIDASNRVSLIADTSGNSAVNCLLLPGVAGNTATIATKTITGNQVFTVDLKLDSYTPAADQILFSKISGNDGIGLRILTTTGVVRLRIGDGTGITNVDSTAGIGLSAFTRATLVVTWTDGVGASYAINGVALGVPVAAVKTLTNAAVDATIGTFTGKLFRLQVGTLYDFNPSTAAKLATSVTDGGTGGGTWTINQTAIDLPARIHGARDLSNATAANMPIYALWSGSNYAYTNSVTGNTFSTGTYALGDDFECEFKITPLAWGGTTQIIVSKYVNAGQKSFNVYIDTGKKIQFSFSYDGTAVVGVSSDALTFTDGTTGYGKITRSKATGLVSFYKSTDGVSWTACGTAASTAGSAIYSGTDIVQISGYLTAASGINGQINYVYLRNSIGGANVRSFNPSDYPLTGGATFVSSATGETWTINGGATIIDRTQVIGNGTSQYLKSAAYALSQPEMACMVGKMLTWTANDTVFAGNAASTMSLSQTTSTPNLTINAGSAAADNATLALKTYGVITAGFNGASSYLRNGRGLASTGDAGTATPNGFTLFAKSDGTACANAAMSETLLYAAPVDQQTQDRIIIGEGKKWYVNTNTSV